MKNNGIMLIVILLSAILSLVFVYSSDTAILANETELDVSTEGPLELSKIIDDVKTGQYYKGYDNKTLAWMESLGDKQVFTGNGTIVVMSREDASKLHSEYVCDAYITQHIKCNLVENHSLGNVKFPKDVLLVDHVKYLDESMYYLQGS